MSQTKKKITLITSFYESPFHKNRAPYNEQLFLQLQKIYDINIIRPIAWADIYRSPVKIKKDEYYKSVWNGIPVLYPTYWYVPKVSLPYNGFLYLQSIKKSFKKSCIIPDIFYTTWAYPDAFAAMRLAEKYNRKYIVRVHGSDINDLAGRSAVSHKIKMVLDKAAIVVSPSKALKNKILNLGITPDKVYVIYSGIDKNRFYPKDKNLSEKELLLEQGKKRIIYIGNFLQAKGVLDLLKAVNLLKNDLNNFEVLFIGKGENQNLMQKYIEENDLEEIVKIIGPVDHHNLNNWINSSDCLCLPSYAEGLPNVVLEALQCQTSVVASNVGGIPEIIENSSNYLVKPGDFVGLKVKLLQILDGSLKKSRPSIEIKDYTQIAAQISVNIERLFIN